ncbi:ABC-type guanosine uptake system NupNOPQ [Commensalibacter communis]|uniref:ABC transporter permease n=1 Tax=Commensalibacter communis TaxID=2972786 RepID=UPI0022FF7BC3|nr:ABC transporter permease [Commensalibacter communis]CAI3955806.1 ABC-type guanosine uptake system NupNOPQ [Commensalibacter communis]
MQTYIRRLSIAPLSFVTLYRIFVFTIILLLCVLTAWGYGFHPLSLTYMILSVSFGTRVGLEGILLYVTPLLLTGAACLLAFRLWIVNNGAEGQFLLGSLMSTWVGLHCNFSGWLCIVLAGLAGIAGGILWILVPTLAKIYAGVNEILTTLMLNFIATFIIIYCVTGPLAGSFTSSPIIPIHLPLLWGNVHIGILIALFCVFILAWVSTHTKWGYELRVCGASTQAAHYIGLSVNQYLFIIMLISGGLSGLAGMLEVVGTVHRLQPGISNGLGYLGIVVSILARNSFLSLIPSALLIAFILNTSIILQTQQLNNAITLIITGLLLLLIAIADELAHYQYIKIYPKQKEI